MSPDSSSIEDLQVGCGLDEDEMGKAGIVLHQLCEAKEEEKEFSFFFF